ncbi:tellurite resistance protein TehA-like permease [Kushneria sinocarnis]|uniref:Tellurite resistance protein TehA-like permease n=1 Tax=Kushneria sinocarnis TaxID=595502 RepID=A0A420X0N7_9GAMM|nr:TDT family transporter [Kushneria sinocarnis]RKR07413.1 tellurite resistance protein TehA-like permease [Kushneria sinocarnis]
MLLRLEDVIRGAPTPMAGLALGIASLGWSWESLTALKGVAQQAGAAIAAVLLLILAVRFIRHPQSLRQDLAHPVVGSVVPTFAMALMVVSKAFGHWVPSLGTALWLVAVGLHLIFLSAFVIHRCRDFRLHHMVPGWFVPPVGIIVADVAFPGVPALQPLALGLLWFGMIMYALLLPVMVHRLIFSAEIPDAAKPTIAIMAAPASLSLAGYLTVSAEPSPLLVALLGSIALLMTVVIYLAFFRLLRLPFSPAHAAFTFPMVIGATAMAKTAGWLASQGVPGSLVAQVQTLADIELTVATVVVGYVALRYATYYGQRLAMTDLSGHPG